MSARYASVAACGSKCAEACAAGGTGICAGIVVGAAANIVVDTKKTRTAMATRKECISVTDDIRAVSDSARSGERERAPCRSGHSEQRQDRATDTTRNGDPETLIDFVIDHHCR